MGQDIFAACESVRLLYERAEGILGFDLAKISFAGPEELLRQTRYTQPALYVHSYALYTLLRDRGVQAQAVAGHSLGEFTALAVAGAWDFEQGLRIVHLRAELMQSAGQRYPGAMAAIIGLEVHRVEELCAGIEADGPVVPSNYNAPDQVVISGPQAGVEAAMALALQAGAKRALALKVSAGFHSPLMEPVKREWAQVLRRANIHPPALPVYCNVTAQPVQNPEQLRFLLEEQLVRPVQWMGSIESMLNDGISDFLEIGSGTVLSALVRKINRQCRIDHASGMADLAALDASDREA